MRLNIHAASDSVVTRITGPAVSYLRTISIPYVRMPICTSQIATNVTQPSVDSPKIAFWSNAARPGQIAVSSTRSTTDAR